GNIVDRDHAYPGPICAAARHSCLFGAVPESEVDAASGQSVAGRATDISGRGRLRHCDRNAYELPRPGDAAMLRMESLRAGAARTSACEGHSIEPRSACTVP